MEPPLPVGAQPLAVSAERRGCWGKGGRRGRGLGAGVLGGLRSSAGEGEDLGAQRLREERGKGTTAGG